MAMPQGKRGIVRVVPVLAACGALGVGYVFGAASAARPMPSIPARAEHRQPMAPADRIGGSAPVADRKAVEPPAPRPTSPGEPAGRSQLPALLATSATAATADSPPLAPDVALFFAAERHAGQDDPVAALEVLLRDVPDRQELVRDLELETALPFRKQSRLEFARDIVAGVQQDQRSAELERAIEVALAVALRVAREAGELHRVLEQLRITWHPATRGHLFDRLPDLGWSSAYDLLASLRHQDPARHDRLLATWIENHPGKAEDAERYRLSFDAEALLAEDLAAVRAGDASRSGVVVERLVERGRADEATALVRELATRQPIDDVIQTLDGLPTDAQRSLPPDLFGADAVSEWLRNGTSHDELPDGLAPEWQARFAAQRWSDWSTGSPDELHFDAVAGMAAWQAARFAPSPLTRAMLERTSCFRPEATADATLSREAHQQIVRVFRLGHRDLAIAWMQRRLALLRAGDDAAAVTAAQQRLTRMRHGVDPLLD